MQHIDLVENEINRKFKVSFSNQNLFGFEVYKLNLNTKLLMALMATLQI
jgi:hypothetical protein